MRTSDEISLRYILLYLTIFLIIYFPQILPIGIASAVAPTVYRPGFILSGTDINANGLFINNTRNLQNGSLQIMFDNGTSAIGVGVLGEAEIPEDGTITAIAAGANGTGNINVTVEKIPYAQYPNFYAANYTTHINLSNTAKNKTAGLSVSVSQGDWIRFNISEAPTVSRVTVSLTIKRA